MYIPEGPLRKIFEYLHWFRTAELHEELFSTFTFKIYNDDVSCYINQITDRHTTYRNVEIGLLINVFEMNTSTNGVLLIQNTRESII